MGVLDYLLEPLVKQRIFQGFEYGFATRLQA